MSFHIIDMESATKFNHAFSIWCDVHDSFVTIDDTQFWIGEGYFIDYLRDAELTEDRKQELRDVVKVWHQ